MCIPPSPFFDMFQLYTNLPLSQRQIIHHNLCFLWLAHQAIPRLKMSNCLYMEQNVACPFYKTYRTLARSRNSQNGICFSFCQNPIWFQHWTLWPIYTDNTLTSNGFYITFVRPYPHRFSYQAREQSTAVGRYLLSLCFFLKSSKRPHGSNQQTLFRDIPLSMPCLIFHRLRRSCYFAVVFRKWLQ